MSKMVHFEMCNFHINMVYLGIEYLTFSPFTFTIGLGGFGMFVEKGLGA